jgi:hypothetical protein
MNRQLADKFFTNQATPEETRRVLEWFETPEGKTYLQERLDADEELMNRRELADLVPELDSDMLYYSIRQDIRKKSEKRGVFSIKTYRLAGVHRQSRRRYSCDRCRNGLCQSHTRAYAGRAESLSRHRWFFRPKRSSIGR